MCITHGAPAPTELIIWDIAERFGWELDYIEGLPYGRLNELILLDDARMKGRAYGRKSSQPIRGNKRGH